MSWASPPLLAIEKGRQEYDAKQALKQDNHSSLTRPLTVGGTNVNPFSKDITKEADQIKEDILQRTKEIYNNTLPTDLITHTSGNLLGSSIIFSTPVNSGLSAEHVTLKQETSRELEVFTKAITAYTTFSFFMNGLQDKALLKARSSIKQWFNR